MEYAEGLDFSSLDEELKDFYGVFGEKTLISMIDEYISGDLNVGYEQLFAAVADGVISIAKTRVSAIISVFMIAVFAAIIGVLRSDFSDGVNKLCDFIFSALIIVIISSVFYSFYSSTLSSVERVTGIIQSAYPVMLTIFVTLGANGSGSVFSPAVSFLGSFYTSVISGVLLPIISLSFVFVTVGNLSDSIKLSKFGEFFKSSFKWIIGFLSLIFCFVLSVQGVVSSTFDGFSYKALKFAFSNGVPIVSQIVQGGFDVVFASLVLIKNSVGIIAMIMLVIALIKPIIEIAVTGLILRLAAALTEPIGARFAQKSLSSCADVLNLLNGVLISVGICFMLTVFMMIVALGVAV